MSYRLNSIFSSVVFKTLAQVDLPGGSHQHEINGSDAVRGFFGTNQPTSGPISWLYFSDNLPVQRVVSNFTFYDARANNPNRTEWRMYYYDDFLSNASVGDILILARTLNGEIFGLVFQKESSWLRSAQVLFQLEDSSNKLKLITNESLKEQELEFAKRQILEELGIEVSLPLSDDDIALAERELALANTEVKAAPLKNKKSRLTLADIEGRAFPSTKRMSNLAQSLVEIDGKSNDLALIAYIEREERIFRAIENLLVSKRIETKFLSVDDFIEYSKRVQNRRKSRMGFALQNHLAKIFTDNRLKFDEQILTEDKSKPDFIFPGKKEYHDRKFKSDLLIMLAAKSSCKERWRQILPEANRIPTKHLCTLEQSISVDQTSEMAKEKVVLVIPSPFHNTYTNAQQKMLWSLDKFVDYVKHKQAKK